MVQCDAFQLDWVQHDCGVVVVTPAGEPRRRKRRKLRREEEGQDELYQYPEPEPPAEPEPEPAELRGEVVHIPAPLVIPALNIPEVALSEGIEIPIIKLRKAPEKLPELEAPERAERQRQEEARKVKLAEAQAERERKEAERLRQKKEALMKAIAVAMMMLDEEEF